MQYIPEPKDSIFVVSYAQFVCKELACSISTVSQTETKENWTTAWKNIAFFITVNWNDHV